MIKYNNNTINDWFYSTDNIIKVYRNNAICYYKIDSSSPSGQTPCFAVVEDISQYSDTEFEDVYDKATEKWFKLNNLNQYEEYGVYGSGRNVTTYEGKLTIDDGYEYIYSGGSWVNVGEVSGSTIQTVWFDPPSSGDNARFDIGHYWGENYKMIWTVYLQGSYSIDVASFWWYNNKSPIELSFYSNGYYYDMHNPTSTSSPSVHTSDYSYRIMRTSVLRNYENGQVMNIALTYGSVKIELEDGTVIESTGSTRTGYSWYDGLYEPYIFLNSGHKCHVSRVQVYNANDVLVNDLKFVKNNTTGSQEISMYDSVLNVTYNNTNSNTPTYHVVEEGGGIEYPVYYDEIQDPPNNLSFSSMTEAEAYECPWVGMHATIDGDKYVFSGDSVSGYEWVYQPITCEYKFCGVDANGNDVIISGGTSTLTSSNWTSLYPVDGIVGDATTTIGMYCFKNISGTLTALTIGNTVTTIEHEAFMETELLTTLTIPASVTQIDFWAFTRCNGLNEVIFKGTTPPTFTNQHDGVFHDYCPPVIYVPDEALSAYRAIDGSVWTNQSWSTNIIQPISNRT